MVVCGQDKGWSRVGDEAGRFEDGGSGRDVTTSEEESEVTCGALHQLSCRQTPDL
jgi:hypothetical protein